MVPGTAPSVGVWTPVGGSVMWPRLRPRSTLSTSVIVTPSPSRSASARSTSPSSNAYCRAAEPQIPLISLSARMHRDRPVRADLASAGSREIGVVS